MREVFSIADSSDERCEADECHSVLLLDGLIVEIGLEHHDSEGEGVGDVFVLEGLRVIAEVLRAELLDDSIDGVCHARREDVFE